jgi:hypothetical protein
MNAIQALSLRKPDVRNASQINPGTTEGGSRFGKRSNIKEILTRNFFRKYPLHSDVTDMQQLQIERKVAAEMEKFIAATKQINSKNLTEFEVQLA